MRLLLGGQTLLGSPQQREQVDRPFCQPEYKCLAMGDERKMKKDWFFALIWMWVKMEDLWGPQILV